LPLTKGAFAENSDYVFGLNSPSQLPVKSDKIAHFPVNKEQFGQKLFAFLTTEKKR
jgi:hypothetical protein